MNAQANPAQRLIQIIQQINNENCPNKNTFKTMLELLDEIQNVPCKIETKKE